MSLRPSQLATIRFLVRDVRMVALSPEAFGVYLRLVLVTEEFGRRHPTADGAYWPTDAMLARICATSPEAYASAVAEMTKLGLYEDRGGGGFDLVLPE